ncbi:MAG: hypothetical protein RIQ89_748 [Bacteroidota bacterium]|jgi:hypothetical protein
MRLIEFPKFYSRDFYESSVALMVDRLKKFDSVVAVYQIGSVSVPGISDLDMVVVFEDGKNCNFNPLSVLSESERYLFIHSLFGINKSHFAHLNNYQLQINYNLCYGAAIDWNENRLSEADAELLKTQIALEYLVKNYITSEVQSINKLIKVRSLLLEVNALKYDFQLLNITTHPLLSLVNELIEWRKTWFESNPSKIEIKNWVTNYFAELKDFIIAILNDHSLFNDTHLPIKFSNAIKVHTGNSIKFKFSGLSPFYIPGVNEKLIYKAFQKFNKYEFQIPLQKVERDDIIKSRFQFLRLLQADAARHFPYFQPLTSVMPLY